MDIVIMKKILDEEQQYEINKQLHLECYNLGNKKDILKLIAQGADIHHLDEETMSSPLSVAASMNNVELVELFFKMGVSPKEHNNLALKDASNYDALDTIELLVKNGGVVEAAMFLNAYNSGNWEVAEYFIKNFNIILSEEVLERMKKDDENFFHEVNNIVKAKSLYRDLNKELNQLDEKDIQRKLKI
jgi:ankyrin repeat protein